MSAISKEYEWVGRTCDLFHDTHFKQGGLEVTMRPIGGEHGSSTAFFIRNRNEDRVKIKFSWYNIPSRRKRKVYDLKSGQQKRFVVPPQRRVLILWKVQ